ncbi:hypothetical protein HHI36_013498 [Cryptolaemus montrouzieri]|uniref:Uncharacterized protein n=1 Tax=Cryptolaemus montrouzieri TaxID=559131 RepID=A0ABD2NHX2_9CUCU
MNRKRRLKETVGRGRKANEERNKRPNENQKKNLLITKKVIKKKKVSKKPSIENSDSKVENTPCLYCNGCYLESNESSAACSVCGKWDHCSCAGIGNNDEDATFTCVFSMK